VTRRWGLAGLLLAAPGLAAAQEWAWQAGAQGRVEHDSNPGLQAGAADGGLSHILSGNLSLERRSEVRRSRLELDLISTQGSSRVSRGAQGHLTFQHSLSAPLDTWSLGAGYRRDRTLGARANASDVVLGDTARSTADTSLGWSRSLSERLSAQVQWQWSDNRVDRAPVGSNYRLGSGSANLQHLPSETSSLNLNLSRSRQLRDAGGTITTQALRLGWTQSVSETLRWGASLGRSETTREFTVFTLVCPLPRAFCDSGLVRPVVASQDIKLHSRDSQYSANGAWRQSETGDLSVSASRALNPGLLGVTRDDSLGLAGARASSDRLRWRAAVDLSRSLRPGATADAPGARSRLATLTLGLSQQLAERWQLDWQAQHRVYDASDPQIRARSNRFSISLQYLGARVSGSP
jgi:hypothetical protein